MNTIRSLALAAAVTLVAAVPASAMMVADVSLAPAPFAAPVDFSFSEQLIPGAASRLDRIDSETARAAAASYFDYDTIITLGALALAGGGMAAFAAYAARRRTEADSQSDEPAWRQSVFRAIQADLAQYTDSYRRAA